ncbi:MAG TPA: ECF-type sigma factor [Gemmatimonadaceae bacterium]|nr:ECF-type sigma factor [Gemmatimonadaceae bacterium]
MTTPTTTGTVTRLLAEFERGDLGAMDALFPIVYDELRKAARHQRARWSGDTTIDTTALVHETYLKLTGAERIGAQTRVHFLRIASRAMRHILSNYARDRRAAKRGGDARHIPIEMIRENATDVISEEDSETLGDLAESLNRLELFDRRLAEVVECRFFGELSIEDTAGALGISQATVKRDWALARAWLYRDLSQSKG